MGCKCVVEEPWVTVAESSELVIALVKLGLIKRPNISLIHYINGAMKMGFIGLDMFIQMKNSGL